MKSTLAYLSQGLIHLKDDQGPARVVESRFAQAVAERILEIDQRHSWKAQGRGAQFMSRGLLWAGSQGDGGVRDVAITSLSRGREVGELLYSLETKDIAGVFARRGDQEDRLFHGSVRHIRHLAARHDRIACSLGHESGSQSVAVMEADGSNLAEVTEGDSVDQAPSWIPGSSQELVFQSAGIGRDREGHLLAVGPFAIKRLSLERGEIDTLAEDPRYDFLGPKMGPSGDLFYIRRPYAKARAGSLLRLLKDLLLMPARLLEALFQWLNFFSVRYSGKPLTTAGGPKKQGADLKRMMVWGNLIDAEQAAREEGRGEGTPDLVPASWQLVREKDKKCDVLAGGVLSFDVGDDGSLVYTNGSAIFNLSPSGERERLLVDARIEQVVLLR
jgi:hypothetical protein